MAKKKIHSSISSRPPVVAVLGHVDHGKTSLLDKIRQTNVVAKEFGGITQHIGAYQIKSKDQIITFIDTPGHAAFSAMRSRGAQVADLAILVVAADEGVKPQTLESLKYIEEAKIPYLVAINKIDLPHPDLKQLESNLAKSGIKVESQGGKIVVVPVSAKTGRGINELLEMILLLAAMEELKGDKKAKLEAVVIESKLDKRRGFLATILVRNGCLKIGDEIEAEGAFAKIKAMFDEKSQSIKEAGPSQPVEILGFKKLPEVGSLVKPSKERIIPEETSRPKVEEKVLAEDKLRLIVKADVQGTLEAILAGLSPEVVIVNAGVGEVNESDIFMAATTKAEIIAFNVKITAKVKKLAEMEKVKISPFQIIYKLFETVDEKVKKRAEPFEGEIILGKAEILKEFEIDKKRVAGCRVLEGEVKKTDKFHLQRGGELLADGRIKSMKTGKEKIEKAKAGEEFGALLSPSLDFQIGDMLISYKTVEEQ
jgi:translation initiation factor IF-2